MRGVVRTRITLIGLRALTGLLVTLLTMLLVVAGANATSDKAAVKKSVKWIDKAYLSQFGGDGFRADTVSALVAARKARVSVKRKTIDRFMTSLREGSVDYAQNAGTGGKLALAAVAAGDNPRCFGLSHRGVDLVAVINNDYKSSGQFGRSAYDHAFALLGLRAARERIPAKAVKFAKARRGKHGWNFAMSKRAGDDVESTSLMIQALRAAGVKKKDAGLKAAYRWLRFQRNRHGGYHPNFPQGETQADATALVIAAARSLGHNDKRAKRALKALQTRSGAFRAQPSADSQFKGIATGSATMALSGRYLPVTVRRTRAASCG